MEPKERSDGNVPDQAEFWLQESQREARLGTYELDVRSGVWRCTETLDDIFGIAPAYPRSVESWVALLHPDDRDEMTRYFLEDVLAQKQPFSREYRIVRVSDGETRWVHGRGDLIIEQGEPVMMLGTIQDVTERMKVETALREEQEERRAADASRRELLSRLVAAQEEERKRLAEDIHDDSIQIMAAAAMRLSVVAKMVDDPEASETLVRLEETIDLAISRLRYLVFDLRPRVLDEVGLAAALRASFEGTPDPFVISVEDRMEQEPPPDQRATMFRIALEAVANVRKHAGASKVDLDLEERDDGFLMVIMDDGVGFDTSLPYLEGMGLASIRERAELAGGWRKLRSAPGAGTKVEVWLPAGPGSLG